MSDVCAWAHLEAIRAGAAVEGHGVVGAGAVVPARAGQAGVALGLDVHVHRPWRWSRTH